MKLLLDKAKEREHYGITIRSYYGNLVIDFMDFIFAAGALILIWISCKRDDIIFFGISAIVYLFPRLLSLLNGITNNGRDFFRQIIGLISMVAAIVAVFIVFGSMADRAINPVDYSFPESLQKVCFVFSGLSLLSSVYRLLVGVSQKVSLTYRNSK